MDTQEHDNDIPSLIESELFQKAIRNRQFYLDDLITFPHHELSRPTYFPVSLRPAIDIGYDDVFSCEYLRLMKAELDSLPTLDKDFIERIVVPFYRKYYRNTPPTVCESLERLPYEQTEDDQYEGFGVKSLPLYLQEVNKKPEKILWVYDQCYTSENNLEPIGRSPGWLFPEIVREETMLIGRWRYLSQLQKQTCFDESELKPIPFIEFSTPDIDTLTMLDRCLNAIDKDYDKVPLTRTTETVLRRRAVLHYFIDWLLWSLGHDSQPDFPLEQNYRPETVESSAGIWDGLAHNRLIQVFNPTLLLLFPSPFYLEWLLIRCPDPDDYGVRRSCPDEQTLEEMTAGLQYTHEEDPDLLSLIVDLDCDTGVMLAIASNYSLELMGLTYDPLHGKMALINSYFYIPWNIYPLKHLNRDESWLKRSARKSFSYNYIYNYLLLDEYYDEVSAFGVATTEKRTIESIDSYEIIDLYNSLMPIAIVGSKPLILTSDPVDNFVLTLKEDAERLIIKIPPQIETPKLSLSQHPENLVLKLNPSPPANFVFDDFVLKSHPSVEPIPDVTENIKFVLESQQDEPQIQLPSPSGSNRFLLPPGQASLNLELTFESQEILYDEHE